MSRGFWLGIPGLLLGLAFAAILAGSLVPSAEARSHRATVSPGPTSKNASIWSEISFRGVTKAKAGKIEVRGRRSGGHRFKRRGHSDHRGFSLVMKRPFVKAERVTVKTRLAIPGASGGKFTFRVENIGARRVGRDKKARVRRGGSRVFHSRPNLRPFMLRARKQKPSAGSDPIFIGAKKRGNAIFAANGDPIWFRSMRSTDFRSQIYEGRPVLTWYQSPSRGTRLRRAKYMIANDSYRIIRRIIPGNGYPADSHEFRLTSRGTAYLTTFRTVRRDLRRMGLKRKTRVVDSIAQEVDLKTGRVIWEWHSLDHVPVRRTYAKRVVHRGDPFDYFHMNSIIDTPDGNVMISGRSTSAVYKVSRGTGKVIWELGGKRSDYRLHGRARFSWQHDAEPLGGNRVSLFDNHHSYAAPRPSSRQSRGLVLRLDNGTKRATLEQQFLHPRRLKSFAQANVESLPSGNFFVGWGQSPWVSEYDSSGKMVFNAKVVGAYAIYRAYRMPWSGHPTGPVAIKARRSGKRATAWVSWNGDTEVTDWKLLSGTSRSEMKPLGLSRRTGFETRLKFRTEDPFVQVLGMDRSGEVIGFSPAVPVPSRSGG